MFAEFYDKFYDCYRYVVPWERERLFQSTKQGAMIYNTKDYTLQDFGIWFDEFKTRYNVKHDSSVVIKLDNIKCDLGRRLVSHK